MNECCLVLSTMPHGPSSAHKTGSAQAPKQPVLGKSNLGLGLFDFTAAREMGPDRA